MSSVERHSRTIGDMLSSMMLRPAHGQSVQLVGGEGVPWKLEKTHLVSGTAILTRGEVTRTVPASMVRSLDEPVS